MNFDDMNPVQRRLHDAACVMGVNCDEYGFEQLQRDAIAEIERLRTLLAEAGTLFRVYEQSHRAKGPGHEGKVERNAEIAGRIEAAVTPNF